MKNVQCPHCHKTVTWSTDSPYRPFCSERCRLIDLGAWADGSYSIPISPMPTSDNALEFDEDENKDPQKNSDNNTSQDEQPW